MITLMVDNLPREADPKSVRELFAGYGTIQWLRVVHGPINRPDKSQGVVKMSDQEARAALASLDGKLFKGSLLQVREAQEAEVSPPLATDEAQMKSTPPSIQGCLIRSPPYQVTSVDKVATPDGGQAGDWYRYVLTGGRSRITGVHCGTQEEVMEYAAKCVEEFNLRNLAGKSPPPWTARKKT